MGKALLVLSLAASLAGNSSIDQRIANARQLEQSGKTTDALAVYRTILPEISPHDSARAPILESVAGMETDLGDYAAAIRDANEAAVVYASQGDSRRRGWAVNRVGLAQLYRGDYAAAQRSFDRAIALSSAARDDGGRAEATTNRGNAEYFVGRYADAAADYAAALRATRAHRNEPWFARRERIILVNQATLDQRLGRDQQALSTYHEVLSQAGLRPREQAQILVNLGVLYRHLGDPVKALAQDDEALALFSREHLADGELGVLKNRGIVLALDLNRLDEAQKTFSDALDRATRVANHREMLQAQLYRGETELRRGDLGAARRDFTASLVAARTLKTPEEEWKSLFGLARADLRSGQRAAATENLLGAISIIEQIREAVRVPSLRSDFFNDKREVYDALIDLELEGGDPRTIFEMMERSHSRAWRDRLGLTAPVTLEAVRRALPPGVLLLDTWIAPQGGAVVMLSRDRVEVRRFHLEEGTIRSLLQSLSAPGGSWRPLAAVAAAQLLPRGVPAGTRHVLVIPDRSLTLLPFELLTSGSGLLLDQAAVSYAPTAAILFRSLSSLTRFAPPWTPELTAFGDPLLGSTTLDDRTRLTMRLGATATEIHSIDGQLGGASFLHLAADDRKALLLQPIRTPVLHIASHAVADANAIEQSRILFSPAHAGDGQADYLFLKEAYGLALSGVELAVLSACDTERGLILRGEGVESFSRAFLAAGARSTVTTLWRVPDAATAAFMKVFYHHLQRGASRAEALRLAKLRFARSGTAIRDPHYWAAFVLTGDGLHPIPTAIRWNSILLAGLAALAGLMMAWLFRRRL